MTLLSHNINIYRDIIVLQPGRFTATHLPVISQLVFIFHWSWRSFHNQRRSDDLIMYTGMLRANNQAAQITNRANPITYSSSPITN